MDGVCHVEGDLPRGGGLTRFATLHAHLAAWRKGKGRFTVGGTQGTGVYRPGHSRFPYHFIGRLGCFCKESHRQGFRVYLHPRWRKVIDKVGLVSAALKA